MRYKNPENGFTLYELLITLVCIAIISGIAIPSFIGALSDLKLDNTMRELQSNLQLAKLTSIKNNCYTAVLFYQDKYIVFKDNGENAMDFNPDADETILTEKKLGNGIRIDLEKTTFAKDRMRFNSRGNAGSGSVVIVNNNNKKKKITVSRTGRIRANAEF